MTNLDKIKVTFSALSNSIILARFGKDKTLALETRDVESEFWQVLVQYAFDGELPQKGESVEVHFEGRGCMFKAHVQRVK